MSGERLLIMRWLRPAFLSVGRAVFALPSCYGASFNCLHAHDPDEILICSDPELSAIDGDLGVAFKSLREQLSATDREKLRLDELQWIRYRNDRCGIGQNVQVNPSALGRYRACLYPLYQARIAQLRSYFPSSPSPAAPAPAPNIQTAPTAAEAKPSPPELKAVSSGTAFAINPNGEFLTNYHVIKGCAAVSLGIAGVGQHGTVIATDERNDLAAVHTRAVGIEPLRFRDGRSIRPGDGVVVLGFPYAGLLTTNPQVTTGSVSALAGIGDDTRFLQLTAPVQPGNSGGPLLDLSSNVVGLVSSRINDIAIAEATGTLPQNINFAIKGTIIREFLDTHGIAYTTAQSTNKLEPSDVAETATKATVKLSCYQ